jgi:hypothetical protein
MLLHRVRASNVSKGIMPCSDFKNKDSLKTCPRASSSTRHWSGDGKMLGNLRVVSDNRCETLLSSSTSNTTITLHSLDMKRLCRASHNGGSVGDGSL